jgi:predicted tellurium resistance membrane protein TerC
MFTAENIVALLTLTAMEIVLGIDNIVFIAILAGKLPPEKRKRARRVGLLGAMVIRVLLLLSITWIMQLTNPLFALAGHSFTGRDLVLLIGGLFLIAKATHEIHGKLEAPSEKERLLKAASMKSVIIQIMLMDIIFSLDSVITAVGMAEAVWVMIVAVILAVGVMMVFAGVISDFVDRHPTVKMLALSFLLLIGVMLAAEGFGSHVNKGYIYAAMAFSLFVEILNMRFRKVQATHQERKPPAVPTGGKMSS